VHGLSRKTVFAQGEPGPHFARPLIEALGGGDVYADSEMDRVWIEKLCATADVRAAPDSRLVRGAALPRHSRRPR